MDLITLRRGSHGSSTAELQRLLNAHGAKLTIDGWFGTITEAAVELIQRRAGLVIDGDVGVKTWEVLRGQQNHKRLREADLIAAADKLGVTLAAIKAVNAVESNGSGFLSDGRPVILLERHIAYREASHAGLNTQLMATRYPNLINAQRGGYAGGTAEWVRFASLCSIAPDDIAIQSCSWGLFQIMGYHYQLLGYASPAAFRTTMEESEGAQLDAFVRFIEADPELHKALKAKKWAEFARRYNGAAYKENLYDAKLAAAFSRFSAQAERLAA